MVFQPVQIHRRSDSVMEQILDLIRRGRLEPGDPLPGQREISKLLKVGRSSVREALRSLETLGVVETRPGLGTFVRSASLTHVSSSLSLWLAANRQQVLQILEVREAVESKAAALAAMRATPDQLTALESCLAAMREAAQLGRARELPRLDLQFHELISEAARNELLKNLIDSFADVIRPSREAILDLPGRPLRSVDEHEKIMAAMHDRDEVHAAEAMVEHLAGVAREIGLMTNADNSKVE